MNYTLKKSFNLYVQEGIDYCIPASVQSIFNYHKSQIKYHQLILLQLMILYENKNHLPSFQAMSDIKDPRITNEFNCTVLNPSTFKEWTDNIINEISSNRPIAISTKFGDNAHIRVAIGIDDTNNIIKLYNPGVGNINKTVSGYNVKIYSGIENYSFTQAQADWDLDNPCHDQLQIIPI